MAVKVPLSDEDDTCSPPSKLFVPMVGYQKSSAPVKKKLLWKRSKKKSVTEDGAIRLVEQVEFTDEELQGSSPQSRLFKKNAKIVSSKVWLTNLQMEG